MNEVIKDELVLARHITQSDINNGLNFFSNDNEFIQVGAWRYDKGKILAAHVHNEVPREITRTYEVLYVIKGRIQADIYDLAGEPVKTFTVGQGEILTLLESGHGYKILEDDTVVLEIKNGPYMGADVDRRRL